jgi:hypothetical protein
MTKERGIQDLMVLEKHPTVNDMIYLESFKWYAI